MYPVNNLQLLKPLICFDSEDDFYFIQILKRRKDNPEMTRAQMVIDNFFYYIDTDFESMYKNIIDKCDKHNARAYINLNRLNVRTIAIRAMEKTANLIANNDYRGVKNAYAYACGNYTDEKIKRWVVDVDNDDSGNTNLDEIVKIINSLQAEIKEDYKVLATIPTKNGYHVITNPFNLKKFNDLMPGVLAQKNSPTILYIP
jgi:Zn-finger domain-containing protein